MRRERIKGWGPQNPPAPRGHRWRWLIAAVVVLVFWRQVIILAAIGLIGLGLHWMWRRFRGRASSFPEPGASASAARAVQARSAAMGGGVYLGVGRDGRWRCARPERALLLLGPPRSGKTSAVILPALLAHDGPAVSTSTKPDVLTAAATARSESGQVWVFDPAGVGSTDVGLGLRWSPVTAAASWDGALLMARSMVTGAGVGLGTTDGTHWSKRAQALLAALLHAAALDGAGIDEVRAWVLSHELDEPGAALQVKDAKRAAEVLIGLVNTEQRERSSILSAAADALDAYSSESALAAAADPNFDADAFVRSRDTIYVHAPAEHQQLVAPLVCGLLSETRAATYRAHARGELERRVLFALDEVANIAPLAELPAIASEGGGQGLLLLAALQDLSQARARWGVAADGFLTLFGSKLLLPGIADRRTLESVSVALGEYDRVLKSTTSQRGRASERSTTVSTHRERVISPGDVANIPAGRALHLNGVSWELVQLTPAYAREPWRSLVGGSRS